MMMVAKLPQMVTPGKSCQPPQGRLGAGGVSGVLLHWELPQLPPQKELLALLAAGCRNILEMSLLFVTLMCSSITTGDGTWKIIQAESTVDEKPRVIFFILVCPFKQRRLNRNWIFIITL